MNMHEVPELSVLTLAVATPFRLDPPISLFLSLPLSVAHFPHGEPDIMIRKYLMGDTHKEYSMGG